VGDTWYCPGCGFGTDNPGIAREHECPASELDMADWYCPDHPDGFKEFDGEHWVCIECGEPLQEKPK